MKSKMIDASDVTQKALLGIDDGWYETFWYSGGAQPELRLLAGLATPLKIAGRAIRAGFAWADAYVARGRAASVPPAMT